MKKWTFRTAIAALLAAWALFFEGTASLELSIAASVPAGIFLVGWIIGKIRGSTAVVLAVLLLVPACTIIQHDVHIDENAVQVWGKDVEAVDGVVTPRATPGAPGEIPTAQSSGQRYILIQIYQGADSKQETTTDAKLDATVTPIP